MTKKENTVITDIAITHTFDGYDDEEIDDAYDLLETLKSTYGISFKLEIENEEVFSITLNHINETVNVEKYIEMEKGLFKEASEELLELLES
jgi:CRISPR/Cas system-associated protein Cas7 (RAMP superfamily)